MNDRIIYLSQIVEPGIGKAVINQLRKLSRESNEDITLFISSFGGCCRTMVAIRDEMRRTPADVRTFAVGKAMSAGCLLLAAGAPGKRGASTNVQIMIHEPNGQAELDDAGMSVISYYNDYMINIISEDTGLSKLEVEELTERDKYLTAEEALEKGFIDHIVV